MTERTKIFSKELKYIKEPIINGDIDNTFLSNHIDTYGCIDNINVLSTGQIFLFETFDANSKELNISEPIMGILYEYDVFDQAMVTRWLPYPRTKDIYQRTNIDMNISSIETIDWGNTFMLVYGYWDVLPDWKTIRRAYEKTWTYYKDRDKIIDGLLNS